MSSSCCFPKLEMSSIKLTNITQRRHEDNPNRIISQYYESLIQEIDSYTKKRLAKSSDADTLQALTSPLWTPDTTQVIDESTDFDVDSIDDIWCWLKEKIWTYYKTPIYDYKDGLTTSCHPNNVVKLRNYLKQARSEMLTCLLDELAKAQSDAIDRYETIKGELAKRDEMSTDKEYVDEIEAQLFADKFYFLARFVPDNKQDKTKFKLNLVVVDFYLNRFQRELLNHFQASSKQVFISFGDKLKSNEAKQRFKSNLTIDKDNLLIFLLFKYLTGLYESTSESSAGVINPVIYVKQQQLISNMKLLKIDWLVLTKLCTTCFHPLSHLERLMLGRCDFANVSSDAFKSLVNLKFLELDEPHNCSHIDLNVLAKLRWLLFVDAYLPHQIPKTAHPKLEILEYHHDDSEHDNAPIEPESRFKPIETIRGFEFANLKILRLKYKFNMDRFELDWMSSLAGSLRYLSIESCRFRCFSLGNHIFGQLVSLRLDSNSLEKFDGNFNNLANLKSLRISQNELKFRDDMFQGLLNLKQLSVTENGYRTSKNESNNLNKIDNCHVLRGLVNLESLDLSCNNLTYIEPELFAHLPNLDTLNLFSNMLNSSMVFVRLPCLRVLNLGMNNMGEELTEGMFSELVNLEVIDLRLNNISKIRREVLKGLEKLKVLKIGCNRIKTLPLDSFLDLKNLIRVDLASNPIGENFKQKILEVYSNIEIVF